MIIRVRFIIIPINYNFLFLHATSTYDNKSKRISYLFSLGVGGGRLSYVLFLTFNMKLNVDCSFVRV